MLTVSSSLLLLISIAISWPLSAASLPIELRVRKYDRVQAYVVSGRLKRSIRHATEGSKRALSVNVHGAARSWTIRLLSNRGLISPTFALTYFDDHGNEVVKQDSTNCYYHGRVEGVRDSHVSISTCSGLRGLVYDGNETFHIHPAETSTDEFDHILFKTDDVRDMPSLRTCGNKNDVVPSVNELLTNPPHVHHSLHHMKRRATNQYVVELVIVADNTLYKDLNSNATAVRDYCGQVANTMDGVYKRLGMGFRVALTRVEVWSADDRVTIHDSAFDMLEEFTSYVDKLSYHYDNVQLITGNDFDGSTVGMAHVNSICNKKYSSGVNQHLSVPESVAAVMSHEMGHNFGMNHDDGRSGCSCSDPNGCVMSASSGGPARDYVFSECSKSDLQANLKDGLGYCLYNQPTQLYSDPVCGNGFKEAGEQCDCGREDECLQNDPCCQPGKCILKATANCSEGECCHNCQFRGRGSLCRDVINDCDFPEYCTGALKDCPQNICKQDGVSCDSNQGYCYQALCRTHSRQCTTLWGPDGSNAPETCYQRINIAGDLYGHCGKTSNNKFKPCEASDVFCGKIQCSSSKSYPIIGTTKQSTSYTFGNVTCRGASVNLGEDILDPGVVEDGTKCGENKICLSNKCEPLSFLNTQLCPASNATVMCSGHGVCSSVLKCYCDDKWAPPLCDQPGNGGMDNNFPPSESSTQGGGDQSGNGGIDDNIPPSESGGGGNGGAIAGAVIAVVVVVAVELW
ncbi:disintegrin and metalloproteinase domain-containing protein 12-like isoform X1 [Corticium candelabrum]|uniref:disintegrin and metalloproteinase domain-containing protein 12-like isoform X1 n=1 Tax=Corticium candelabrum TaxID=121492 RepID=UPI002E258758|nr:disintegrin and metalloproteinase domain-containing protein 12-like isoform X1 [Corticium candelabrum]